MFNSLINKLTSNAAPAKSKMAEHVILKRPIEEKPTESQGEIIFGCGCFWGAEKGFWKLPGVINTAVGYAGGKLQNPNYNMVCSGLTEHTEVVKVIWDKNIVDLSDLLKLFWECHDPTQGNRQGNDRGSQYRSAIYTTNLLDKKIALDSKDYYQQELEKHNLGKITTEIKDNQVFYFAEQYHQQYLAKPGCRPYCSAMPTQVKLGSFPGSDFRLPTEIWEHFDWSISHCVLRSDNNPIPQR